MVAKDFERKVLVDCHNTTQIWYRHKQSGIRISETDTTSGDKWAVFLEWRTPIGSEINSRWANCLPDPENNHDVIFFKQLRDAMSFIREQQ